MSLKERFGIGLPFAIWRQPYEDFKWEKETADKLLQDITDTRRIQEGSSLSHFKALVIGAHGHGKSALINSFASISFGGKTSICNAATSSGHVTTHYRSYKLPGKLGNFVLDDISGIKMDGNVETLLEDIRLILKGHIKDGYKLDPNSSISPESDYYVSSPDRSDMIHCAILVIDSEMANDLPTNFVVSIRSILETINAMNIPVLAVLTKCDKLSSHVKYCTKSMFRCTKIKTAVEKTSRQLTIPVPKVYPVVNFEEMDHFTWKESIPLLLVLKAYLEMAMMHSHNK